MIYDTAIIALVCRLVFFSGGCAGPIGTVFFTYVFILISISIPTFEKNRAKSASVSDLPRTSNKNI